MCISVFTYVFVYVYLYVLCSFECVCVFVRRAISARTVVWPLRTVARSFVLAPAECCICACAWVCKHEYTCVCI